MLQSWVEIGLYRVSYIKKGNSDSMKSVWSVLSILCLAATVLVATVPTVNIIDKSVYSEKRFELMSDYAKFHYSLDSAALVSPNMVIIHYTAMPTLELSFKAFKPDIIPKHRERLSYYGDVNVGAHFLIDKDGSIHQLLPLDMMGRHAIGYNHKSIGIENVSADGSGLTVRQVSANAKLIAHLHATLPSIKYVFGHHEYMNQSYPHFKEFHENDAEYRPSIKLDPGFSFIKALRAKLKFTYGLEFEK